ERAVPHAELIDLELLDVDAIVGRTRDESRVLGRRVIREQERADVVEESCDVRLLGMRVAASERELPRQDRADVAVAPEVVPVPILRRVEESSRCLGQEPTADVEEPQDVE